MCTTNLKDFDDWRDLNKLREEVEAQKAKVESLQSEQKWMKNSFSASDLCNKNRLDRSDSGIDRQSLIMEGRRNDSSTNALNEDCSTSSIKKIIEITSLIRAIEQQLNISKLNNEDSQSMKTYSSTCSMPRCIHEFPEHDYSNTSWIHNQLMASSIEHEKLSKQLSHFQNQRFKIENVKMPVLLNGITADQLKKRIEDYYSLKTCLTDLATSSTCNGTAMITVVKQLEPIAQSVEYYLRLSQELKNLHTQISVINQRKNTLQNKRYQLLKILHMSNNQKPKTEMLPQSVSWNEPCEHILNARSNYNLIQRKTSPHNSSDDNYSRMKEKKHHEEEINDVSKGTLWPPFNGDGTSEENPPPYDENLVNNENKRVKSHSRSLCHEYVNDDVIRSRETRTMEHSIDLIVSSFPYESIAIVQVKGFKLQHPLHNNQQYRARILQLNGEGSDWNTIYSSDDGRHIFISPHIMLPITWNFNASTTLSLLLELQVFDKGLGCSSNCFMFNITPLRTTQQIAVPLHSIQTWINNAGNKCDLGSSLADQNRVGSLKISQRTSACNNALFSNVQSGMHLLTNPILNRSSPPIHYSNIRRSQTYSHDHQYCGKYECCSSIDFVSEPVTRINPKDFCQPFHPFENESIDAQSPEESVTVSSSSSFKRQSIFRQPIRLKRSSTDRDSDSDQHSQTSDHRHNDILIQDLWTIVCDLYVAISSVYSVDERLLQFAYFKTRCPPNLMKLYNYFVETIFDPDQK